MKDLHIGGQLAAVIAGTASGDVSDGQAMGEPEGRAHHEHLAADLDVIGVAELHRPHVLRLFFELQQRQITRGVGGDHRCVDCFSGDELDLDLIGGLDHVCGGDDLPIVHENTGTQSLERNLASRRARPSF